MAANAAWKVIYSLQFQLGLLQAPEKKQLPIWRGIPHGHTVEARWGLGGTAGDVYRLRGGSWGRMASDSGYIWHSSQGTWVSHTHIMGEILAYSRFFSLQGAETHSNKLKPQKEMSHLGTRPSGKAKAARQTSRGEEQELESCQELLFPTWACRVSLLVYGPPRSASTPSALSVDQCPLHLKVQASSQQLGLDNWKSILEYHSDSWIQIWSSFMLLVHSSCQPWQRGACVCMQVQGRSGGLSMAVRTYYEW